MKGQQAKQTANTAFDSETASWWVEVEEDRNLFFHLLQAPSTAWLEEGAPAWQRRIGSLAHRAFPPQIHARPPACSPVEEAMALETEGPAQTMHRVMTDSVHPACLCTHLDAVGTWLCCREIVV